MTAPALTFINANHAKQDVAKTAMIGNPLLVHLVKMIGACPRNARPYKIRDEQYRKELPAEKAEVKMAALMMEGRTVMPALVIAMT